MQDQVLNLWRMYQSGVSTQGGVVFSLQSPAREKLNLGIHLNKWCNCWSCPYHKDQRQLELGKSLRITNGSLSLFACSSGFSDRTKALNHNFKVHLPSKQCLLGLVVSPWRCIMHARNCFATKKVFCCQERVLYFSSCSKEAITWKIQQNNVGL